MYIRPYRDSDYVEIADLIHGSVHAIDEALYSRAEREAWAPTPPDYDFWKNRLAIKKPLVALEGDKLIGFIELENDGHIDCLYVHKDYQGSGVASSLLHNVQMIAQKQGIIRLSVEASKLAMPLFKKFGFEVISVNEVKRRGQSLTNYCMASTVKLQQSR